MERPILRIVGVSQECLSRTIFPMGQYHKEDIKQMAIDRGYEELATKPKLVKFLTVSKSLIFIFLEFGSSLVIS